MARDTCPACETSRLEPILNLETVPIYCNVLYTTPEEAVDAPRGHIELGFCNVCGLVHNREFEPDRLRYAVGYENSLEFSPRFQRYASDLVERLIARYDLVDKDIIEIGCGSGEFLFRLCRDGRNRGVGFDPSYVGPENECSTVNIVREEFSPKRASRSVDLICCRHVLEHIPQPDAFLQSVRQALPASAAVYFEVPNGERTLVDLDIWDIIYEHCSYFSRPSLVHLFERSGFRPSDCYTGFGDQFLSIEATASRSERRDAAPLLRGLREQVATLTDRYQDKVSAWEERLTYLLDSGRRVALWGAGSKGVTFLSTLSRGHEVHGVVDINPRKHGRYIPVTAQRVSDPPSLAPMGVDTVLVMNAIYEEEIRTSIKQLNCAAEVCVI